MGCRANLSGRFECVGASESKGAKPFGLGAFTHNKVRGQGQYPKPYHNGNAALVTNN